MNNENLNNSEIDTVNVMRDPDLEFGCMCKAWFVWGISGQHVVWELCTKHFQIMQHMASIESCDFERNKVNRNKIGKSEVKQDDMHF